jgi:ATP-dependent 26S proteasome regulatory subunit
LATQLPRQGLVSLQCNDLSQVIGRNQQSALLQLIELLEPSVILLDDVDRITGEDKHEKDLLYLLAQRAYKEPLVIIGTANKLHNIPTALRRPGRFDETIIQSCPTIQQTSEVIKLHVEEMGTKLSQDNINKLSSWAYGLTPAYLREIAKQATIYTVEELENVIIKMKGLSPDEYPSEDWATTGF